MSISRVLAWTLALTSLALAATNVYYVFQNAGATAPERWGDFPGAQVLLVVSMAVPGLS
jgi:hypothetical protein